MITVAETNAYQRKVARLLSEREREDLVAYLSEHPNAGVIMEGTGGIWQERESQSVKGRKESSSEGSQRAGGFLEA